MAKKQKQPATAGEVTVTFGLADGLSPCERDVTKDETHRRLALKSRPMPEGRPGKTLCAERADVLILIDGGKAGLELCAFCYDAMRRSDWPTINQMRTSHVPPMTINRSAFHAGTDSNG